MKKKKAIKLVITLMFIVSGCRAIPTITERYTKPVHPDKRAYLAVHKVEDDFEDLDPADWSKCTFYHIVVKPLVSLPFLACDYIVSFGLDTIQYPIDWTVKYNHHKNLEQWRELSQKLSLNKSQQRDAEDLTFNMFIADDMFPFETIRHRGDWRNSIRNPELSRIVFNKLKELGENKPYGDSVSRYESFQINFMSNKYCSTEELIELIELQDESFLFDLIGQCEISTELNDYLYRRLNSMDFKQHRMYSKNNYLSKFAYCHNLSSDIFLELIDNKSKFIYQILYSLSSNPGISAEQKKVIFERIKELKDNPILHSNDYVNTSNSRLANKTLVFLESYFTCYNFMKIKKFKFSNPVVKKFLKLYFCEKEYHLLSDDEKLVYKGIESCLKENEMNIEGLESLSEKYFPLYFSVKFETNTTEGSKQRNIASDNVGRVWTLLVKNEQIPHHLHKRLLKSVTGEKNRYYSTNDLTYQFSKNRIMKDDEPFILEKLQSSSSHKLNFLRGVLLNNNLSLHLKQKVYLKLKDEIKRVNTKEKMNIEDSIQSWQKSLSADQLNYIQLKNNL